MPEMPITKAITFKYSLFVQLGAIFKDEGIIEGIYRL